MGGKDVTWEFVQTVSLWFLGVFKLFLWLLFLAALWLTLWARQLRKWTGKRRNEPRLPLRMVAAKQFARDSAVAMRRAVGQGKSTAQVKSDFSPR